MHIDEYDFGKIVVDGREYDEDLIVFPDRLQAKWIRDEGHSLHPRDIEDVLDGDLDVLIVGTGAYGRMRVLPETEKIIESHGVKLITQKTGRAVSMFNKAVEEGKSIVAVLHLTC